MLRIGLAALRQPESVPQGVDKIRDILRECSRRKVRIVCFPEAFLPGLRGADFDLPPVDQPVMEEALREMRTACGKARVAAIVGLEWLADGGLENRAVVIASSGRLLGHQTKNQITPGGESRNYVPDGLRRTFRVDPTVFGITICHEGWRYPSSALGFSWTLQ